MTVIEYLCSKDRPAPAIATIGGPERQDRSLKTIVDWNDDRAIGLHKWLPTDDTSFVRSRLGRTPRQSTVGGGAHLDEVSPASVVELGITVPEERAASRSVADAPVF